MKYKVIRTGSKGNAVIINNVLIDCGVPFKALKPYCRDIDLVLLTHIHSDHFRPSTVKRLAAERPTLRFGCGEWLVKKLLDAGVNPQNTDVLEMERKYDYGGFRVKPFMLLHHDAPNCGYKLFFGGEKVFYATDTGTLEGVSAKGYDYYFIEANYGTDEIRERIAEKKANGEFAYEKRAVREHLSVEQANNFIYANMSPRSQYIFLHGHDEE